ncbi:TIGR03086 family metal-binding protein [Nocardia sp.]|uniref:TIGR03086 family metal-binding protein n=1 Tax=Nocardia sp. TaxID=1821 RepID=UPI00261A1683|nr:TIGR03086 family metal-binding protein [Nocardia sp.]
MGEAFDGIVDRFVFASREFERRLRTVRGGQWVGPTPCTEWNVRQLVNHMVRGNLNYVLLVNGGGREEFLRMREVDAMGDDPVSAYVASVRESREAFAAPGVLDQVVDYPMGQASGRQALAVRTADTVIHTWDLARAIGAEDLLDTDLIAWIDGHLEEIYAGLSEMPASVDTSHRYFAVPESANAGAETRQDRLLRLMGRNPDRSGDGIASARADRQLLSDRHRLQDVTHGAERLREIRQGG